MARFNGVLDQIKKPECQIVIGVLLQAKSRQLATWKRLMPALWRPPTGQG